MGGFFGAISKRDCVLDIFFGVDYHSHLGTRVRYTTLKILPSARNSNMICGIFTGTAESAVLAIPTRSRCWCVRISACMH